jgi:hypothetical protein
MVRRGDSITKLADFKWQAELLTPFGDTSYLPETIPI